MEIHQILGIIAIAIALVFEFINGFHDTANACATVVETKALGKWMAISLSGIFNFIGAVTVGTAVAVVITKIIPANQVNLCMVTAALLGASIWNLFTWYKALPVSSSHCLIGSLFGVGVAAVSSTTSIAIVLVLCAVAAGWMLYTARNGKGSEAAGLVLSGIGLCGLTYVCYAGQHGVSWKELWPVFLALLISPVVGFVNGMLLTAVALKASGRTEEHADDPETKHPRLWRWLQIFSSMGVSFAHGTNDAQKGMGIITLILATCFASQGFTVGHVPWQVMVACAFTLMCGTFLGGGRVMHTVGKKVSRKQLDYAHGFGAETSTFIVLLLFTFLGKPVSTTHCHIGSVAGGSVPGHGLRAVNRETLWDIVKAWVTTLPAAFILSFTIFVLLRLVFPF
jgi:PiT family inorganic phosphate transporter